jgi:hypothetical protein
MEIDNSSGFQMDVFNLLQNSEIDDFSEIQLAVFNFLETRMRSS